MRWRVLFFLSLGANLILALLWWRSGSRPPAPIAPDAATLAPVATGRTGTNVLIHRRFFSWSEVESDDYPTYIANLREIGCPEQTIRDIIIADVNTLFARRLATELVTPEQEWWRSQPDTNVVLAAAAKARELENERRALLNRLLGDTWEAGDLANLPRPSRPGIVLDGPVLGILPIATKQALQQISLTAQERLRAYVESAQQQGFTPDPAELARLRQQTRDELAGVLTPSQLEEYLLRYSSNANDLRSQLGELAHFGTTPEEFRALFRARDSYDQQLQMLTGNDPNIVAQRNALEQQRESAIRTALGAERYAEYRLLHDPLYRSAVTAAEEAGTPDLARAIYEVNLVAARQQATIQANTNLTIQQREIALRELELQQLRARTMITDREAPPEEPPEPPPPFPPGFRAHSHVLAIGESVGGLALRYGVTVDAIQSANPGVDVRRLTAGQSIVVPHGTQGSPTPAPR